jgi:hypothetical protein
MRGRILLLVIWVAVAMLGAAPALSAQTLQSAGLGEATILVDVEPSQPVVRGAGSVDLRVDMEGSLFCLPGFEPAPLVGVLLPGEENERLTFDLQPGRVVLEWERSGGAEQVEYRLNESATVALVVVSPPLERVVMDFTVLFSPDDGVEEDCTPDGYSVQQTERRLEPLTVEPDPEMNGEGDDHDPRFNWVPFVIAVALLAAVAVFAFQREQRRRD